MAIENCYDDENKREYRKKISFGILCETRLDGKHTHDLEEKGVCTRVTKLAKKVFFFFGD